MVKIEQIQTRSEKGFESNLGAFFILGHDVKPFGLYTDRKT